VTYQIDPTAFQAVIDGLQAKIAEAHKINQRLIHDAEKCGRKIWPVYVQCDGKRCSSVVAFDPEPEEAALAQALRALGWSGHVCPKCQK
jgi:hypothetical protein